MVISLVPAFRLYGVQRHDCCSRADRVRLENMLQNTSCSRSWSTPSHTIVDVPMPWIEPTVAVSVPQVVEEIVERTKSRSSDVARPQARSCSSYAMRRNMKSMVCCRGDTTVPWPALKDVEFTPTDTDALVLLFFPGVWQYATVVHATTGILHPSSRRILKCSGDEFTTNCARLGFEASRAAPRLKFVASPSDLVANSVRSCHRFLACPAPGIEENLCQCEIFIDHRY